MSRGLWSHLSSGESKFTKGVKCLVWKQEQVIDIRKHKYSIIFLARSQGHFDTCEFHHFILILIFVKKKLKCPLVPSPECHNNHSGLYWSLNSHNTQFMEINTTHILVMPQFYTLSFPTSGDVCVLFLTPIDLRFPPSRRNNSYLNDQPSSAYRWLKTLETHQRHPAAGCNPYETVIDISAHSNRL